jgi:enterochelin esterase-like enzyme
MKLPPNFSSRSGSRGCESPYLVQPPLRQDVASRPQDRGSYYLRVLAANHVFTSRSAQSGESWEQVVGGIASGSTAALDSNPVGCAERRDQAGQLVSETLKEERVVTVYTPAGYDVGRQRCGVLVLLDGEAYRDEIPTPTILDDLVASRRIPPLVASLVQSGETRDRDLQCSAAFADSLARELPRQTERVDDCCGRASERRPGYRASR